jgi:hypothetical protein
LPAEGVGRCRLRPTGQTFNASCLSLDAVAQVADQTNKTDIAASMAYRNYKWIASTASACTGARKQLAADWTQS